MKDQKVTIAWECQHCGKRHLWPRTLTVNLANYPVAFRCDNQKCKTLSAGTLVNIGRNAYAMAIK